MKRAIIIASILIGLLCPAAAFWQSRGSGYNVSVGVATYQGPGDVVASPSFFNSCARVVDLAHASTATSLCDLKDKTTGAVAICTLRGSSSGFVDLVGGYCVGSTTPAVACAAAAGGACIVSKVYDQTGNGHDFTQATAANMPAIAFGVLNSLPVLTFTSGSSQVISGAATITAGQPFSMSVVVDRTSSGSNGGYLTIGIGNATELRGSTSAATAVFACGTNQNETLSDNAWHGLNATCSSGASAINIDGVDNTGISNGSSAITSGIPRLGESSANVFVTASIAEAFFYPIGLTPTQRSNLYTNMHGANGYNGAF